MNIEEIRIEIIRNGFERTHDLKKLEEFESLNGHVIYLYKKQALLENVQVMVNPQLDEDLFSGLKGVGADNTTPLRSGSNMRRFPKRHSNNLISSTCYGRSMRAETLGALERLLQAVITAPVPAL